MSGRRAIIARRTLAAFIAAALFVAASVLAVALWNPWYYLHLKPLADADYLYCYLIVALLAVPAILALLSRKAWKSGLAFGAVTPFLLSTSALALLPDEDEIGFRPEGPDTVVARSADRRYEVRAVRYRSDELSGASFVGMRIRRPHGWRTVESDRLVARFWSDGGITPVSVTFVGGNVLEVWSSDAQVWRTTFDRGTTRPDRSLSR